MPPVSSGAVKESNSLGKTLQGACCCRQHPIGKLCLMHIGCASHARETNSQRARQSKRVRNVCLPRALNHLLFPVLKWWAVTSGLEQYFKQVVQKRRRRKSQQNFPHCPIAKHFHSWVPTAEYRHQVSMALKLKWLWNKAEPVAEASFTWADDGTWQTYWDLQAAILAPLFPLTLLKAPSSLGLVPSHPGDPEVFWHDSLVTSDRHLDCSLHCWKDPSLVQGLPKTYRKAHWYLLNPPIINKICKYSWGQKSVAVDRPVIFSIIIFDKEHNHEHITSVLASSVWGLVLSGEGQCEHWKKI